MPGPRVMISLVENVVLQGKEVGYDPSAEVRLLLSTG